MDGRVDIVTLNKEQEVNLIQSGALRSQFFKDTHKPLVFIHFSDIHAALPLWNRVAEFMNYYQEYIAFALMTGDYCEDSQKRYVDLYGNGIKTKNPILNCAGNHDTCADETHGKATKQSVYQLLFATTDTKSWGVTFMEGDCSMTYYKDFPESNIRLVVLDYYYDIDVQAEWLTGILEESKENGYQVITAMHEVSHPIVNKVECTFQTRNDYERLGGNRSKSKFETVIHRFKQDGGTHICNLVGHEHSDMIGQLRWLIVESAWIAVRKDPVLSAAYVEYCRKMKPGKAIIKVADRKSTRLNSSHAT